MSRLREYGGRVPNKLADATSPYLLQHKDNPVDWLEWGDEAFDQARQRDVPILLSVGYSACHWCHVMAHESFEDEATAEDMNRWFVSVKVDREERPDVDSIYMEAVQAMSGRGGWPMTVFLTPEGRPFFAGTYFPKHDHHGMPAFRRILAGIAEAWSERREELLDQAGRLTAAISQSLPQASELPPPEAVKEAYRALEGSYDGVSGGFGGAPKFPQQPVLEFLLRVRGEPWAERADEMIGTTLTEMADGGIYDQIGGGFARYSVDSRWLVPHFEKMLYDNAQLARIYLWAGIELGDGRLVDTAQSTLEYMLRDLRHEGGGFFSAEDADSEGVEGKFYTWTWSELSGALGEDAERAAHFFGASPEGNFEGTNILHRASAEPWDDEIESIRRRLMEVRRSRIRPSLDDKVIASWNGLAIRALAEAGAALAEPRYLIAAEETARFLLDHLRVEGRMMRSWREGKLSVPGFLDDHAATALGLFALFAATGATRWYGEAMGLVKELHRFANPDGGFYTTADDGEPLVKRPSDVSDNPLPSGNALAAEALLLASMYTGDLEYRSQAEAAIRSVALLIGRYPSMVGHHLSLLHGLHDGTRELAVVGPDWESLARVYWRRFRPTIALAGSAVENAEVPLLANRHMPGETLAYLCTGFVCDLPTSDPEALAVQLSA